MPWKVSDVDRFRKGLTPAQKEKWVGIANGVLASCTGEKCEQKAVMTANAAFKESAELDPVSLLEEFELKEFSCLSEAAGGATLDKGSMVLRNVKFLGRISKNMREYSDKAMHDYVKLAEGAPVFINHRGKDEKNRNVNDMGGVSRNLHVTEDGVRGDLHYYRKIEADIEDALRTKNPAVGMSLDGRGQLRGRGKGQPALVEAYLSHNSTDFVAFPATTGGLAESSEVEDAPSLLAVREEEDMDLKELQEQVTTLLTEQKEDRELLKKMAVQLEEAEKARKEAEERVKKAEHGNLIQEAIDESKRTVSDTFRKAVLARCATKEEMLEALNELPETKPTTDKTKPMHTTATTPLGESTKKTTDKATDMREQVKQIHAANGRGYVPGYQVISNVKRAAKPDTE